MKQPSLQSRIDRLTKSTQNVQNAKNPAQREACPIDAAIARDIAAIELHGEYASLNFPHLREVFGGES